MQTLQPTISRAYRFDIAHGVAEIVRKADEERLLFYLDAATAIARAAWSATYGANITWREREPAFDRFCASQFKGGSRS